MKRPPTGLMVAAFWLAVWQLVSMAIGQEILMVSPVSTFLTLLRLMGTAGFYLSVGNTFGRILLGFLLALALGAALGTVAVIVRQEIVLFIMGGLFVVEAVSVMLQVGSYKTRKKRIFLMAPIHHHYEQKGWKETQVVVRFWIITIVLVLIGLASLKIR